MLLLSITDREPERSLIAALPQCRKLDGGKIMLNEIRSLPVEIHWSGKVGASNAAMPTMVAIRLVIQFGFLALCQDQDILIFSHLSGFQYVYI